MPGDLSRAKKVVLRDLVIFQVKLALDGVKDVVLSPLAVGAAALDMIFPGPTVGRRFYGVMLLGEKIDRWLNLFGAVERAQANRDGLFGASRAGSDSMLGRLEEIVLGRKEPDAAGEAARPAA